MDSRAAPLSHSLALDQGIGLRAWRIETRALRFLYQAEANPDFLGKAIGFWDPFNLMEDG